MSCGGQRDGDDHHGAGNAVDGLLEMLFGADHDCQRTGPLIAGTGMLDSRRIAVLGTVGRAAIGARLALAIARGVLDIIRDAPGRPILLIVDNAGQKLSRWDELVGNNGYVAHLGKVIDLARRRGHPVVSVVVDLAVSAGFMATGMAAARCFAQPGAELRVMAAAAMARVIRIPEDRLHAIFRDSPALGPGAENFVRIGALHAILGNDARTELAAAFDARDDGTDPRRRLGQERGGRLMAAEVAEMVRAGRET